MQEWLFSLKDRFILNFIDDNRWKYLADGLVVTLEVTFFAVLLGILIGIVIAAIRSTHDKIIGDMRNPLGKALLKVLNWLSKVYLTVFAASNNKVLIAILSFGINSGAYVAEIIRSGIMSIDQGQTEAGRSLGFNYIQTMMFIVLPQAFKNVLPALANEFIVLLKETSVSGYVALQDLTKGADIIRGRTYDAFMPLIALALIYLVLVMFFTYLVDKLERRLRAGER